MATPNTSKRAADGRIQTEADVKSFDGKSGRSGKSSHDNKSHAKAGMRTGAGGGKKRERHH
jgi:hypothetical protein